MSDLESAEGVRLNQILRERFATQQQQAQEGSAEDLNRIIRERGRMASPPDEEIRLMVHSSELGEPGLSDSMVRARVAIADTREEREAAFENVFPLGELRPARDEEGNAFEVFRRDPGEQWRKFDPGMTEKFEPVQDIADFASAALPVVGEAAATRGAGGLIRRVAQPVIGAMVGEGAEEGVEAALDQQRQPAAGVALQTATEGLTAGLGAAASEPLALILNARRGAGVISLMPGARDAVEAAERQGLPQPMPFQIAENPLIVTTGAQAEALTTTLTDYLVKQRVAAVERVNVLRDVPNADPQMLPTLLRSRIRAKEGELDQILKNPNLDAETGGLALQEGLTEYDTLARAEIDDLFATARGMEEPQFDLPSLDQAASDMLEGFIARGDAARQTAPLAPELRRVLEETRALAANPQPITIDRPDGSQLTISVTDQLRALRERLWDLKTVDEGQIARKPEFDAGFMYNRLTNTLENPVNDSPGFTMAWRDANNAASNRFQLWDRAVIRTTAKEQDAVDLVTRFVRPRQVVQLRTLKETVPAEQWGVFQAAARSQLLGDLPNLTRTLDSFDEPTLEALFPFRERHALRQIAENFDQFASTRDLAQTARFQDIGSQLIRAEGGNVSDSVARTIGSPESPEGRALRAAMLDSIHNQIVQVQRGIPSVNRGRLETILRKMDSNGSSRFLTRSDLETLQDVDRYVDIITGVSDVGTSLLRATVVKQLREFNVKAAFDVVQAYGVGRLMVTNAGRRFLTGTGADRAGFNNLRLLTSASATIAADEQALGRSLESSE